ncbi:hypothetical protein MMC11_002701 [Xylographa trunciseda]|nr:hypothetical protein [Xylographa trunciseda]
MNRVRAFGNKVPGDITGIVETYLPGASAFLPILASLLGFNIIDYIWKNLFLGFFGLFFVSISIVSSDPFYGEVIEWLTVNVTNSRGHGAVRLTASTDNSSRAVAKACTTDLQYEPATQSSLWFMRGWWVIYSSRQAIAVDSLYGHIPGDGPPMVPGIKFTTLGFSPNCLKAFLEECGSAAVSKAKSFTTFYKYSEDKQQFKGVKRPTRPLKTINLEPKYKEQLVEDIRRYLKPASIHFYATRGIPHRRGYLFHGPPGTGKTSMSVALAGHFQLDLYIINLAAFTKGDAALAETFETIPRKCIILLEDIDSAGIKRENIRKEIGIDAKATTKDKAKKFKHSITLSGLLNAIDGATAQEGRVLIMTTNDPEALDEALIRPGRIDMQTFFGPVSQKVAEEIFVRMYTRDLRLTESSVLSYNGQELFSERGSMLAGFLRFVRLLSWWKVLSVWLLPLVWTVSALYYLLDFQLTEVVWLVGVGLYTTMVVILVSSLDVFWSKRGPKSTSSAIPNSRDVSQSTELPEETMSPVAFNEREELQGMAREFGSRIPENRFTPAEVQGFLIMNMEDPSAALARIDDWVARLLAAKDRGTNVIPGEDSMDTTSKTDVSYSGKTPVAGHHQHEPPMTTTQDSDPSDQNVVFLEGSPSSHIFPSATRGYKKLTAYFCYTPKGAATSSEEKQRQQTTVQYFQKASKALEAIDGKEAIPSSRYQLSRSITFSPRNDKSGTAPSGLTDEESSGDDENDETIDSTLNNEGYNHETIDTFDKLNFVRNNWSSTPELSPDSRRMINNGLTKLMINVDQRAKNRNVKPAKLNFTRGLKDDR